MDLQQPLAVACHDTSPTIPVPPTNPVGKNPLHVHSIWRWPHPLPTYTLVVLEPLPSTCEHREIDGGLPSVHPAPSMIGGGTPPYLHAAWCWLFPTGALVLLVTHQSIQQHGLSSGASRSLHSQCCAHIHTTLLSLSNAQPPSLVSHACTATTPQPAMHTCTAVSATQAEDSPQRIRPMTNYINRFQAQPVPSTQRGV
jgi:hypothetical protein